MGSTPIEMRDVGIQFRGIAIQLGVIPFPMGKLRKLSATARIPERSTPVLTGKATIRIEEVPLGLRKTFIRFEEPPVKLREARIPV